MDWVSVFVGNWALSDQLTLISVTVAIAGLLVTVAFTAAQIGRAEKTSRGQFLLTLQQMLAPFSNVEAHLRPSSSQDRWPSSPDEWRELENFLAFFEHCAVLLKSRSLRLLDFKGLFAARLENCLQRPDIVYAKLHLEAGRWSQLQWLVSKCNLGKTVRDSITRYEQYHSALGGRPWLDEISNLSPDALAKTRAEVELLVGFAAANTMPSTALGAKLSALVEVAAPDFASLDERCFEFQRLGIKGVLKRFGPLKSHHAAVIIANWVSPREPLSVDAKVVLSHIIASSGHISLIAAWVKNTLSTDARFDGVRVGRTIFGGSLFPEPKMTAPRERSSQLADAMKIVDKAILDMHGARDAIRPDREFEKKLQLAVFMALSQIAQNLAGKEPDSEPDARPHLSYWQKVLR